MPCIHLLWSGYECYLPLQTKIQFQQAVNSVNAFMVPISVRQLDNQLQVRSAQGAANTTAGGAQFGDVYRGVPTLLQ